MDAPELGAWKNMNVYVCITVQEFGGCQDAVSVTSGSTMGCSISLPLRWAHELTII